MVQNLGMQKITGNHKSFFTTQLLYIFFVQIFRLSAGQVKVHQIPHVSFQVKSQFFFKV